MLSVPKSKVVRGFSFFGASFVYIIFEDGTDIYWARSRVLEYLNFASSRMPKGVTPSLGPDATGVGWVYQYALLAKDKTLAELATPRLFNEAKSEKTLVVFYISAYGNTRRMAESLAAGAESMGGVRVSLYDLEGGESGIFTDLIEEADGLAFGSPTINADAVKPIWDVLSSLTTVNVKGKLGAAFGSYGWSGEAVRLIEDRLRGLKLRVPLEGLRIKLVPDDQELAQCRELGEQLACHLTGHVAPREIEFSQLQATPA